MNDHKWLLLLVAATAVMLASPVFGACPEGKISYDEARSQKGTTFTGPFQVEALELNNMVKIREDGKLLPFGYSNQKWNELKSMIKPGDEIFFVVQRDGHFRMDGHALVSNGCIVYFLLGTIT